MVDGSLAPEWGFNTCYPEAISIRTTMNKDKERPTRWQECPCTCCGMTIIPWRTQDDCPDPPYFCGECEGYKRAEAKADKREAALRNLLQRVLTLPSPGRTTKRFLNAWSPLLRDIRSELNKKD